VRHEYPKDPATEILRGNAERSCETCEHARRYASAALRSSESRLYCHQAPPTVHVLPTALGQLQLVSLWPEIQESLPVKYCARWRVKGLQ
jgi:hypothetical protein